jgi:ATP-binding cassette subfamily B protein RaxB
MIDVQLNFGRRKFPVILQSEAAECGLACLAMVASHHGFRTDLAALRARFNVSLKGVTLEQLVGCASQLGLSARAVRLELDELPRLALPCVLHWNLNHFVVLVRADHNGVLIHDPAVGERRLSYDEIDGAFTGVALELTPGIEFKPADERRRVSLRALLGDVRGLWRGLSLVLAMALALEALGLAGPLVQQWVTDDALTSGDRDLLNVLACAALLMMVTQAAISQARGWTLMYLSTNLGMQWGAAVFGHLLRLPLAWFEKRHLGDVVSRFGAASAIQSKLTSGFIAAILDGLMASVTLCVMFAYSPVLSSIVLVSVALYALLRVAAYGPLRAASMEGMMLAAQEQTCFMETIRAVQAIKLAGRELDRRARWQNLRAESLNRSIRTQKLGLVFGTVNLLVGGVASVLVFRFGAGLVMDGGGFTIGMLLAFSGYSAQFSARVAALIDNAIDWKMLSLQCERLADIVLERPEAEGNDDDRAVALAPRIELVDVGFRYGAREPWVVRHVNLTIEPGESVALAGPSGGGKSTLVKLILGVLEPTEGEVRYGGVPLRQLGARAYRQAVAAVMQDDTLLAGSLRDNIAFFDPQADHARVEECARLAAIDNDIKAMPMQYNTLVGDMGTSLSGGQKQRVLLARALYKGPRLLVLDEATSHLDVSLERAVNAAVAALDLTRIIVAHRQETINSATRVVGVIKGGVIDLTRKEAA